MTRPLTFLLLVGICACVGCSRSARVSAAGQSTAGEATSSIAADHQNLQGAWKMNSAMFNGQPIMNDVRWIFDGDTMTVVLGGNYEAGVKASFELGTGDAPKTIMIKTVGNPLASKGYYGGLYTGIYKLSGDKLRVCYDMTGRQYPKSFDAGKNSMRMTYEFTRERT